jgi:hypothetical protein
MSKPNYASLLAQIAAETDATAKAALEAQCYQFPEPLTAAEEDLFNYVSTDYIIANPGLPVDPPMTPYNIDVTLNTSSEAHLAGQLGKEISGVYRGAFVSPPNTFTTEYVDGQSEGFWIFSTATKFYNDSGALADSIITFSSGSNTLTGTLKFDAAAITWYDAYSIAFTNVTNLDFWANLSSNDVINLNVESPGKNSYIGTYYDEDGIIG